MADTKEVEPVETEVEKVTRWRLHVLLEQGVELAVAESVADHTEIDYKSYLALVAGGCDSVLAFDILRA